MKHADKENITSRTAILTIHFPDRKGIVSAVTRFLFENDGNILYLDQHVDNTEKVFFMRIEWDLEGFRLPEEEISDHFNVIALNFNMNWRMFFSWETPKMAIFVSKLSHCLDDILARYNSGEWNVHIPVIISNHNELKSTAEKFNINFYCFPKDKENKKLQEKAEIGILVKSGIDFIVLARYMQILSSEFVKRYENRIINIHHSFLPAFPGAKPYHSAYERGVKVIGATSHYVTEELDAGPIIEQDVSKITHRDSVQDMIRKGRDMEKILLSRAIHAHLNRKIMVYKNKTIVFS
ncbi:MAG: formyltetrahydrofolate deformylase [Bacteroides sp. SM23_62_1]|nr:MAG: formyltetrahydrofolate deformylase [Bacteroides sp. SM23_62_1]